MFVIIVGCSAAGYHLSKLLMVEQHEVVMVEKSITRFQIVRDELGSVIIQGDGTDLVDLRNAGITRADTVVAVTERDETNLVICQMAKQAFSVERTVATIRDPKNQPIFRLLGVDAVINIGDLVLGSLERSIVGGSFNHLANIKEPNTFLVSMTIPDDADIVGKQISNIEPLDHSFISVVVRENRPMPALQDLILKANDEVYAVTVSDEEATLYERLTGV